MKPYISIVIATARIGGWDILFAGLENQTFKNFEVIIADSLYKYRKDIVKEKAKQYSINYKHIEPIKDNFPSISYCHANNSAITHASGDVILFTTDYHYFPPNYIQKHVDFHQSHANNIGYAPSVIPKMAPEIKSGLLSYGNYTKYLEDLNSGILQDYMWSSFITDIDINTPDFATVANDPDGGYDPKRSIQPGVEVPPTIIHLQSESIKTNIVLESNGLNEALDGSHGWQDIEFSHRLRNLFGFKWIGDNTNNIYRTGSHRIIQRFQFTRPPGSNEQIFQKYANGSKDPVNNWSLKEARENIINEK